MKPVARNLMSLAVGAALSGIVSSAMAGGFAIGTQSGSGVGNAFAGGAAVADDASVAWSNPAAMTLIPGKQIAGALHIVNPSFKFQNTTSTSPAGTGDGGDGGDLTLIPNGFFTMALSPTLSFGLALNAPFGLKTEYEDGWRGQFTALKSEVKAVNINPSVAYKVSETVSIGGGLSVQKLDAELTNSAGPAGIATLKADDMGFGFNIGALFQVTPSTRIGAHYRSKIKYELEGDLKFSTATVANGDVRADLDVPATLSLSVFSAVSPQWEFMGDVTWTGWDKLKRLDVIRTTSAVPLPGIPGAAGSTVTSLSFNWDNTLRYGVGANYKWSPQTKLRSGVAFDETPTNDVDRTPRLPDEDRKWIAFGIQWKPSKTSILDLGYAHEFIKDASINNAQLGGAAGQLVGRFDSKVDILSVQYSVSF
jgi:long-chain fatty acid transport protein